MHAYPSNAYKYYLPRICVVAYLIVAYLLEFIFLLVGCSKYLENPLVGLSSNRIKVSIEIVVKNNQTEIKRSEKGHLHASHTRSHATKGYHACGAVPGCRNQFESARGM